MKIHKMSDYNFDHPEITQEQIQHLQGNPLEACQRENESLRIRLNSFDRMLLEAKQESEERLKRIKQVRSERDAAFNEGEKYARGEISVEMGVLRREKEEADRRNRDLEEDSVKTQEILNKMELELMELRKAKEEADMRNRDLEKVLDEVKDELTASLREKDRIEEELNEAKEVIMGKELRIQHLQEEARSMSASVAGTPPVESKRVQALTEQLCTLMAERDDIRQQLEIVTENLMGNTPKELTPIDDMLQKTTSEKSQRSGQLDRYEIRWSLRAPSPLRQSSTPESEEDEDEDEATKVVKEKEEVDEEEEELKQSIETDENDTSMESYQKDKELYYQQLRDRSKKLEKRNMLLERYHDMAHVTRAILSLTPVHFEAFRERKESKRKEHMVLLDVMDKERKALRKQNRKLEKQLQLLADLRRKEKEEDTGDAQDFILTQTRYDSKEEATHTYRKLYEQAEMVMKKMIETGTGVDVQELTELRKERDVFKKRKEELEEEINGPLGLREQLAFSAAEDTKDIDLPRELTRVKAELEWRTKERDLALEESQVGENLTSIKELMDQLSQRLEVNVYPSEEKDEQYKEMGKKYRQCQRELSDEKEKVKTLEKFLEEKYMDYEDIAGDKNKDFLPARLARAFIELYQVKRQLMERTIQRNSLIKSGVGCLATVLRENETLQHQIYTLKKHPDRDPNRPFTDVDLENEEMIIKLQQEIASLKKELHQAKFDIHSANKRADKSKDRLDQYLGLTFQKRNIHPRIRDLRHMKERSPLDTNATDSEVIKHLKAQLQDTDELLTLIAERYYALEDENGDRNSPTVEAAERRLEECMDLIDGPWGQKEAWDNLKELLNQARGELKTNADEWKEKDHERDWAVDSLEKLLKESEEREASLARLLHTTQEDMKKEGTQGAKVAEMEEQLSRNEQRIRDLIREKDENKAEADGLETFLRASETQMTQLEEQLSKKEEKIQELQKEGESHKAETERLNDLLKANETNAAELFRAEEEQYREEIERLHELLLLKEEEDEQFREEIERLHELHSDADGKVHELLDISLATSTRLSDLEAEITRWKTVAGESMAEIEQLQQKLDILEVENQILRITNDHENEEMEARMEIQTGISERPSSPVPASSSAVVPAPKTKKSKKKGLKKKPITKAPPDLRYHPHKDSASEPSDEELETPKVLKKPQPKHNVSVRRDIDRPAPSPSPTPSLKIKLKPKGHAEAHAKGLAERRKISDPTYKNETDAESEDEEIPAAEVAQESPVKIEKMEVEGPRKSRSTRNQNPVYTGELLVSGPGRGQKRKAEGSGKRKAEGTGNGGRGKKVKR